MHITLPCMNFDILVSAVTVKCNSEVQVKEESYEEAV